MSEPWDTEPLVGGFQGLCFGFLVHELGHYECIHQLEPGSMPSPPCLLPVVVRFKNDPSPEAH